MASCSNGGRRSGRHRLTAALAAALAMAMGPVASPAFAQATTHSYGLPSQPLAAALTQIALAADRQIMIPPDLVNGRTAPALSGSYTLDEALAIVLAGTGLSFRESEGKVIVIVPADGSSSASSPGPQPRQQAATGTTNLDAVKVSASRIDRPDFVSPTPILPVSAEELQLSAKTNIAAALNDLPQFRATTSAQTTGTNTGAGSAPVDLRGLGVSRTLVLVDGHRIVGANDLNSVPSALVKYVDVVTGGASAAWGSGAVGGVVNISLDHDFVGTKLGIQGGRSDYGDATERRFEGAWGTQYADGRGHFMIGGEYLDNDGVVPKTSRSTVGRWAVLGTEMMPDVGFSNAAYGGLIMSGVLAGKAFNPDGSLRDFDYGQVLGTSMSGGEGPSNDDLSPLVTPQKRYNLLASNRFDVTDNVTMTTELRYSKMYNNYIWFGDHDRGNLVVGMDNAFLPADVRAAMEAAGETTLTMGRFNNDISFSRIDFQRKTTQATIGFDGHFGDNWRWSASYSHGEFEEDIKTPGFRLTNEWNQALDSVLDASGNPVCRIALTDPSTLCVPINVFGEGRASQAAIDYVNGTPSMHGKTKLDTFGASLRGEPVSLPAGDVSVAVGVEARRESIDQTVGELDAARAFKTFQFSPMAGSFNVKELFAEALIPVVKELPGLNDLSVNVAARTSDYSTTGSIWSWKLGVTNEFFPGFRGRIARSRDIRSANLSELYTSTTTGWNNVTDPFTGLPVYALTNGGGNPALTPEEADTLTAGITWSPRSVEGLDLSVDYFNIDIQDVITTIGAQDILTRCFNGNSEMCSRIERDASGNLTRIVSSYTNLSNYKTDGVDMELGYSRPLSLWGNEGRLRVRTLATWVHSLTTDDGVSRIEYVGSQGYSFGLGVPRWRATTSVGYEAGRWGANVRARFISAGQYNATQNISNDDIGSYAYFDLGGHMFLGDGKAVELYANISNLGNRKAPNGSLYSPYYDVIGRYYTAGVRLNF